jgi:hypothetical protein
MLANVVFWLFCGIFFVVKSKPYSPHKPIFEERAPDVIYFGRAFSYLENEKPILLVRTAQFVQSPSFYAASPLNWFFSGRGITVDREYWGISVGGYYLILVCLLSFLQWYLVGLLIDFIQKRRGGNPLAT